MMDAIHSNSRAGFGRIAGNAQTRVTMPSFEFGVPGRILTHTPSRMSDDELKEAVREQARRDFEMGSFQTSRESVSLFDQFQAVASPDRRSIIANAMHSHRSIFSRINLISQPDDWPRGQTPIHFRHNGVELTNYGWDFSPTQVEMQRSVMIRGIYNDAWNAAKAEAANAQNSARNSGFVLRGYPPLGGQIQTGVSSPQQVANRYEQAIVGV